jgi:hypothetical protein
VLTHSRIGTSSPLFLRFFFAISAFDARLRLGWFVGWENRSQHRRFLLADDRGKAIEAALSQLEKQFGKGSIMRLGSKEAIVPISVISTGSISFDAALGVGGVPRGRVIEIFGPESSGKTTITLQIIAEAQKNGGLAAFVDAEHALDPGYAKKLGVDVDNLLVSQPDYGEQALEIVEALVRSGAIDVLVVDSVAALADRHGRQVAYLTDLHQPDSRQDWRHVRQSGDHHRRPCAQVLRLRAHRYPPHRRGEGRRCGRRLAHQGQDRQEQGGRTIPRRRIRHPLR